MEVQCHAFMTSELGGEWSASRPGCFTPWERAPGTHRTGGWVGPRASLDAVMKRKSPAPAGNRTPIVQPVAKSVVKPTKLTRLFEGGGGGQSNWKIWHRIRPTSKTWGFWIFYSSSVTCMFYRCLINEPQCTTKNQGSQWPLGLVRTTNLKL
jgi:hypothetical protein